MHHPPLIGAQLMSDHLPQHLDWILADQRDLEILDITRPHVLTGAWRERAHHIKTMLDGYTGRLGIHGPFYSLDIASPDPAIQAVVRDRLLQGLEFAQIIGANQMVLHSPFMNFGTAMSAVPAHTLRDTCTLAQHVLAPVLTQAAATQTTIVIETIVDLNPSILRAFIESFASPLVRQSIDIGHVRICMERGGARPDEWVRQNGHLLEHVHIQDTDGSYDWHFPPGYGDINYAVFFAEIAKLPHQPRILFELRDHEHIPTAWQYLMQRGLVR
jgi:sugar phosphate isomerase/epimerase